MDNYDENLDKSAEEQRPKYDLGDRVKFEAKYGAINAGEWRRQLSSEMQKDSGLREMEKVGKTGSVKGQYFDEDRKKMASKTISLISKNTSVDKYLGNKQYPIVPKCTKIPIKPMK